MNFLVRPGEKGSVRGAKEKKKRCRGELSLRDDQKGERGGRKVAVSVVMGEEKKR